MELAKVSEVSQFSQIFIAVFSIVFPSHRDDPAAPACGEDQEPLIPRVQEVHPKAIAQRHSTGRVQAAEVCASETWRESQQLSRLLRLGQATRYCDWSLLFSLAKLVVTPELLPHPSLTHQSE